MAKETRFPRLIILSTIFTIAHAQQAVGNDRTPFQRKYGQNDIKFPFFDLTDIINQQNWEELEKALNQTSHVYYSTDRLITDILELSDIASQINKLAPSKDATCLVLAFQMTVNRSDIDWRHIEDVLYPASQTDINDTENDSLKIMKKQLCAVVLDFQLGGPGLNQSSSIYQDPFRYSQNWELSFTKYAKKILKTILGNDVEIPVGVTINEQQVMAWKATKILRQQEIHFADFLIVNVEFSPIVRMPLDPHAFYMQFEKLKLKFKNRNRTGSGNDSIANVNHHHPSNGTTGVALENIMFMASWVEPRLEAFSGEYDNDNAWAYSNVLNSSESEYLKEFKLYTKYFVGDGIYRLGVISGSYFKDTARSSSRWNVLPYLHTHEVDTSSCQLRTWLLGISYYYPDPDTFAVNEFTWSALAHNEENLGDPKSQNCSNIEALQTPKKVVLFATRGIGAHWNVTQKRFESLVQKHSSVAGMNLTTIVFSTEDAKNSAGNDNDLHKYTTPSHRNPVGIAKFLQSWLEGNDTEVGCAVDVVNPGRWNPRYLASYLAYECEFVSPNSEASLLVIQYKMNLTTADLELDSQSRRDLTLSREHNRELLKLLVAQEFLKENYPQFKRIVMNVEYQVNNTAIRDNGKPGLYPYKRMISEWAYIHGVHLLDTLPTWRFH